MPELEKQWPDLTSALSPVYHRDDLQFPVNWPSLPVYQHRASMYQPSPLNPTQAFREGKCVMGDGTETSAQPYMGVLYGDRLQLFSQASTIT